jgi:hypothetical protein
MPIDWRSFLIGWSAAQALGFGLQVVGWLCR